MMSGCQNQIRKNNKPVHRHTHRYAHRGFSQLYKSHRSHHPWWVCSAFAPDAASRCHPSDFVFWLCDLLCLERRFRLLSEPKKKAEGPWEDEGGEVFIIRLDIVSSYELMTILWTTKRDSKRHWKDYEECWQWVFTTFQWHPQCHTTSSHRWLRLPALIWEIENQHQKRGNARISYGFMKLEGGPAAQLVFIKITHSWVQVSLPTLLVFDVFGM